MYLPDSETAGVDVSLVMPFRSSESELQKSMPSALPAAIAAPRAVVSVIVGLTVKEY
jgi:hypothetical protein